MGQYRIVCCEQQIAWEGTMNAKTYADRIKLIIAELLKDYNCTYNEAERMAIQLLMEERLHAKFRRKLTQ